MHPLAEQAIALHERVRIAVRLVVEEDVVRDGGVRAEVGHESHLAQALNLRLALQRALRVLVPALLKVAKHDAVEGLLRHACRRPGASTPCAGRARASDSARSRRADRQPSQRARKKSKLAARRAPRARAVLRSCPYESLSSDSSLPDESSAGRDDIETRALAEARRDADSEVPTPRVPSIVLARSDRTPLRVIRLPSPTPLEIDRSLRRAIIV